MPRFTLISMYPRARALTGVDYTTLLTTLVETALARGVGCVGQPASRRAGFSEADSGHDGRPLRGVEAPTNHRAGPLHRVRPEGVDAGHIPQSRCSGTATDGEPASSGREGQRVHRAD